jgi:lysophospholipase L1-like esterase
MAVITLVALAAITHFVPGLERFRLLSPEVEFADAPPAPAANLAVGEAELEMETNARPEPHSPESLKLGTSARGPIARRVEDALPTIEVDRPPVAIVDPEALAGFFDALARTAHKERAAITRISHFGDSIIVSDLVSGTLRRKLQQQFGDAGHGFMLLANAWPAYRRDDAYRFASKGWRVSRIVGPLAADGLYGLGGVSFQAPKGARLRFGTAKRGSYGTRVSRFEFVYLEHPSGGKLEINLDGKRHAEVDTNGPRTKVAYYEARVADGEHELEIVTRGEGSVRAFGIVLERDGPGVVLDALGVQGARIRFLDKQDDAHWAEQLSWRGAHLNIFQFGANESADGLLYPMADYYRTMKDVLEQSRRAVPEAGCLVIGAMDKASKVESGLVSARIIPLLVKEQRRAAAEVGCAFFNTYEAMGGSGSMPGWVRRGLGQADLTHPSHLGAEVLGNWLFAALMDSFNQYASRHQKTALQ